MTADKCGAGENEHEVLVKIEYDIIESVDEDGDESVRVAAAAIHTHVHAVPVEVAAQTLMIIAVKLLGDDMAHRMFDGVDDSLAHVMGGASAKAFLTTAMQGLPDTIELTSLSVPNDLSELLGEGN